MEIEEKGMDPFYPDFWGPTASKPVPEGKRVVIKEIVFDLQQRDGTLRYGTRDMGDETVGTEISW
jgi:hypothetical protein